MRGDELLEMAQFVATRAISIAAPPDRVWPWLVQVGFGRAGSPSYDLLDNLGHPSTDEVLTEFQSPSVGDLAAPMSSPADDRTAFRVASIEEPSVPVWSKPDSTWAWRLAPEGRGGTRLVARPKARYDPGLLLPVTVLLMAVGDFPLMRRMLLGIAERAPPDHPPDTTCVSAPPSGRARETGICLCYAADRSTDRAESLPSVRAAAETNLSAASGPARYGASHDRGCVRARQLRSADLARH